MFASNLLALASMTLILGTTTPAFASSTNFLCGLDLGHVPTSSPVVKSTREVLAFFVGDREIGGMDTVITQYLRRSYGVRTIGHFDHTDEKLVAEITLEDFPKITFVNTSGVLNEDAISLREVLDESFVFQKLRVSQSGQILQLRLVPKTLRW